MKTIEQKQIELFPIMSDKKSIEQTDTFTGQEIVVLQRTVFNMGVQFAEEWIDVNDELPENIDGEPFTEDILAQNSNGEYCVVYYHHTTKEFYENINQCIINVVKWRPINRK